ncbi:MAG: AAA family ATPase [Culturomica sp.]|jgi:predicted AAA+ superfamily ATPase|nr:AAA family ATPase [Culturomica sp.]
MQRKIINKLTDWKNSRLRMPLVLTGARQIGKTYSVMQFGKMHYDNVVYFNFEFDAELKRIFKQDLVPARKLSLRLNIFASKLRNITLLLLKAFCALA